MLKRIAALTVLVTIISPVAARAVQASQAVQAGQTAQTIKSMGSISGVVHDDKGQLLPNARLQLRNIDTGQIVDRTRAAADATFVFTRVPPGNYVVEIVDDSGAVLGLSAAAPLAASGAVTGLIVALASTTAAGGAFFASTAGILLLVGLGAGVTAGVIAIANDASPSR